AREVVLLHVNAAPESRLPGLVGGVVVARPLEPHVLGWPELELEEGVLRHDELPEPAREVVVAREAREHLGGGATERAVAREVAGKGRRHERGALIGNPRPREDPA